MLSRALGAASRVLPASVRALVLIVVGVLVPAAVAVAAPVPGIGVLRLGEAASVGTSNLPKYSYVILAPHKYTYIAQIKAASPSTKVVGYKSAVALSEGCGSLVDTCVSGITYEQALAHDAANPGDPWVLRDASGKSIVRPSASYLHLANVGSASYQRQWLTNVLNAYARLGFDGPYLDDLLAQVSGWSNGVYPTLYPSDSAWETAMTSFIAYVGPQLKGRGKYVLANTYKFGPADGSATVAWWKKVGSYVSAMQREYWVQNPNSLSQMYDTNPCCWTGHWEKWLLLADAAKSVGADFFALHAGASTDTRAMMYGKASFLLVWGGAGGGFIFNPRDNVDPWNPAWTTNVGTPLGARYQVGVGWRRDYSAGTALVNPNAFSAQTYNLGGSYLTPTGATVSSVTLLPLNAMILTRAATPTASPPANTSPPTLSGSAQQGQTLSASSGSWTGSPSSYAYQWRRCDSSGGNCTSISDATASSYTLASSDVGATIRVVVTASNSAGSASAASNPTPVVAKRRGKPTTSISNTYAYAHTVVRKTWYRRALRRIMVAVSRSMRPRFPRD
jgi:hypothetical protein